MFLSFHKYSSRDCNCVSICSICLFISVFSFLLFSLKVVLCQLFYAYVSDLCVTVKYCTNIQLKKTLTFLDSFQTQNDTSLEFCFF